uniref:Uncharacterized protein n=1 Tax=Romanomermis culicivorax TaxID=13658 RepID=A0A915HG10_ROMCU
MLTQYALTMGIREHLVNEFRHVLMLILVEHHCHMYMAPVSTYVAVISRDIVVWHLHLRQDIFQLMVGQLTKKPYFIQEEYKKHNIRLITEDGKIATAHEFMCGYLTTRGYRPKEQWSLETAYNYFIHCLKDPLTKWASWSKNQDARKEADELANIAH